MSLMKWMRILFSLFLLIGLVLTGSFAIAEDDEATLSEKAAGQLIDGMPDFFKDVIELQKMSPHEKVDYILTKSEDRIKEKVADQFKADMEKRLTEYAKAAFLAKANKEAISAAYLAGGAIDWDAVDINVNSKVDTKMKAFGAAISTAKLSWGVYGAYNEGGSNAVYKFIGGEASKALAEAYIPGWGAIKIGAELTQVLVQYILDEATRTALEGMLNSMYGMKSDPQGLVQWLIDKSPEAIKKDLDDKWNAGMGYGYVFEGQGTDKGDAKMYDQMLSTLVRMRGEILAKKREEERKHDARMSRVNEAIQKARSADDNVKATAEKARESANVSLAKVREFRLKVTGIAREAAEKRAEDAEKVFEAVVTQSGPIPYQPISRITVISALDTALSEIHDSGQGGYDQAAYDAAIENYKEHRKRILEAGAKAVADGVAEAQSAIDRIHKEYLPQITAARNKSTACAAMNNWACAIDMQTTAENIDKASRNASAPYWPITGGALNSQFNADVGILVLAENSLRMDARERYIKRHQELYLGVQDLQKRLQEAGVRYNTDLAALVPEIDNLHHNYIWRASEALYNLNFGFAYVTAVKTFNMPGDVTRELEFIKKLKKELTEDGETAAGLHVKEKAIFQTYKLEIESIAWKFKEIVPTKLYSEEIPSDRSALSGKKLVKPFLTDLLIGPGMQEGTVDYGSTTFPGCEISIPKISIPKMREQSIEDCEKAINSSPTELLAKKLQQLDAKISILEGIVDADQMLVTLLKLFDRVMQVPVLAESIKRDMAQEKVYLSKAFYTESQFMHVELTPGLKYLKDLKAAWQVNEIFIRKMEGMRNAAKKQVQYSYPYQDRYYPIVEKLILTPEKINLAEEEYAKSQKKTSDSLGAVDTYLAEWKNKLVKLEKRTRSLAYLTEDVQKLLGFVNNQVDALMLWNRAPHKDFTDRIKNATEFQKELQVKLKQAEQATRDADAESLRSSAVFKQQSEAEQKKKSEEEVRRASALVQNIADVKAFYDQFKRAYEGRDDSQVMSLISDQWQAGDGSTLSDLQMNLGRSFKMFDEIKYNIQNLSVTLVEAGRYIVSYEVTITSRIYKRNLKHEEKSSIKEEVVIDSSGKTKISKTLGGSFWYIQ